MFSNGPDVTVSAPTYLKLIMCFSLKYKRILHVKYVRERHQFPAQEEHDNWVTTRESDLNYDELICFLSQEHSAGDFFS